MLRAIITITGEIVMPLRDKINRTVVAIIGSTKFKDEMQQWAWEATKRGFLILSLPFAKEEIPELEEFRGELKLQQFQRIRMADYVQCFNKDGYIGDSTQKELEYAIKIGKPIWFLMRTCNYCFKPLESGQLLSMNAGIEYHASCLKEKKENDQK
jgi:hypothetical protein